MSDLRHGDCLEVLRGMGEASVDSVVTDPPYGLSFMGKKWDYDVPSVEIWAECLRVLKPGGHLLAFAGTRTQHRMAVRIEDAGFEIRDMLAWVYGSGFPKGHNLDGEWEGWGTALKPALEPITMARQPLVGTVAANVQQHGTGALNIDGCRVAGEPWKSVAPNSGGRSGGVMGKQSEHPGGNPHTLGRWPANLLHDGSEEVVELFPDTGKSAGGTAKAGRFNNQYSDFAGDNPGSSAGGFGDSGSAARFFYCAKASKRDRDEGCEGFAERQASVGDNRRSGDFNERLNKTPGVRRNAHPTVKPTELMRYLCRLVTPKGGIVLDPFMGSGSTGKAAELEGFRFIGIEREAEYVAIAKARIGAVSMPLSA